MFEDFIKLKKQCTTVIYSFLVNDTTVRLGNSLHFRCNLLERIYKVILTIYDKIRDENCNKILIEKHQIYQHYHQAKLINMNILQVKKLMKIER